MARFINRKEEIKYLKNHPTHLAKLIPIFVAQEIWFYHTEKQKISANSKSIRWAIKKYLKEK